MKKRGQVTLFIIIGIVVLVGASVFFVYTGNDVESKAVSVASVSSELLPVNAYIENCIKDTAIAGLKLVGDHGGYVDLEDKSLHGTSFALGLDSTSGDVVEMFDGYFVPYWNYMKSSNDLSSSCEMSSKMPPLKKGQSTSFVGPEASIESQLERYMDRSISCTGEFPGFTVTGGNAKTEVTIVDGSVRFFVKYPVKVVQEGSESTINEFLVDVPVNLKRMYELAQQIVSQEQENKFLERNMISLLNIYSGVDSSLLPPMHQTDIDTSPGKFWIKNDVEKKVVELLNSNMPLMQIQSADNFGVVPIGATTYAASTARLYDNMVLPINGFQGSEVRFNYFDWPIYFRMDSGELIRNKLNVGNELLSFIGLKKYNNVYDVSFPVAVELRDTSAFTFGNGFSLTFFLEANIRNNKPYSCSEVVYKQVISPVSDIVCDLNQRNSGEISVKVTGGEELLSDSIISYNVGSNTCEIGRTNQNGNLVANFPVALGGIAKASKTGYIGLSKVFSTDVDINDELEFELPQIKTVKFDVKKVMLEYNKDIGQLRIQNPVAMELDSDEFLSVVFTRIGKLGEDEFVASVEFLPGQENIIDLAPGTYSVSANLMKNSELLIPEKEECGLKLFSICTKKFKVPEIELPSPHVIGGIVFDDFTVSNSIGDSSEFVLKVMSAPEAKTHKDLEWYGAIKDISKINRIYLLPEYK